MPAAGRLGDKSQVPSDAHGCPACPHPALGPAVSGSPTVFINGLPALRVGDSGIHAACCGTNTWRATHGAKGVFINGKAAHRLGDAVRHCGGVGRLIEGSADVVIGDLGAGGSSTSAGSALVAPSALALGVFAGGPPVPIRPVPLSTVVRALRDPAQFLSDLLKKGAAAGIDRLGEKLLGDWWNRVKRVAKTSWKVLRRVPGLSKYLKVAENLADNLFDSLAYAATGQLHGFRDAPRGNVASPDQLPVGTDDVLLDNGDSAHGKGYFKLPLDADVTQHLRALIEELRPVVYTFDDDAPTIGIAELRAHSDWDNWSADNPNLDIDDDYARNPQQARDAGKTSGPYLSAWKVSDQIAQIEVGFLRATSYLPHPDADRPLTWEHEGDGERAFIYLRIDQTSPPGEVPVMGKARVVRVVGTGHGAARAYDWDRLTFEHKHVVITIARGSHATGVFAGRLPTAPSMFAINSDVYPGPGVGRATGSKDFVIAERLEAIDLYHEPTGAAKPHWGCDVAVGSPYPVWRARGRLKHDERAGQLPPGAPRLEAEDPERPGDVHQREDADLNTLLPSRVAKGGGE